MTSPGCDREECQAIIEILRETNPDLPDFWRMVPANEP
jgi:hypothetical protein